MARLWSRCIPVRYGCIQPDEASIQSGFGYECLPRFRHYRTLKTSLARKTRHRRTRNKQLAGHRAGISAKSSELFARLGSQSLIVSPARADATRVPSGLNDTWTTMMASLQTWVSVRLATLLMCDLTAVCGGAIQNFQGRSVRHALLRSDRGVSKASQAAALISVVPGRGRTIIAPATTVVAMTIPAG